MAITTIALVVGGAVVAAAQQPAQTPSPRAHHGAGAQGDSTRHFGARRGFGPGAMQKQLFKGITLSDAEKTNIKSVHTKYEAQMKALREQFKNDTSRVARRDAMTRLMQAERADLRAALTPANQAKFDANVQAAEQRLAKHANKRQAHGKRPPASL